MKKIVDLKEIERIRQDIDENTSAAFSDIEHKEELYWGLTEYTLSQKDIEALQQGKAIVLAARDEYLVSITLDISRKPK